MINSLIIFLDIDGVLNYQLFFKDREYESYKDVKKI